MMAGLEQISKPTAYLFLHYVLISYGEYISKGIETYRANESARSALNP
jgi:hypothetical protein